MDELVQKAKKHDKEAFSQLMRSNCSDMYKVAKAILKNDDDAADAMQETLLICWEKIDTLKNTKYFKTWLIKILINCCNAMYRQRKRYMADEYVSEASSMESEYTNIEWKEFFKHLEEKYRTVIILYYIEGFKVKEIAQILEISESTVKGRLVKAREKMERIYKADGRFKVI